MPAHQSLQQFINQSPWRWAPVRATLAHHVQAAAPARAWVLSRVVIPKRGDRSVGVERQFLPEAGRMVNCQIGLAVSLVTDLTSVPVNWRILLPKSSGAQHVRKSAHIPDHVQTRPEWRESAGMVREMAGRWGLPSAPVVGGIRYLRQANELVADLAARDIPFVLEVGESLRVMGRPHHVPAHRHTSFARRSLETVLTARDLLHSLTGQHHRHQAPAAVASISTAMKRSFVRSSRTKIPVANGTARPARLITELPPNGGPPRFWITNLMEHRIDELMSLARLELRAREDMQALERDFGLRDFEGRSFRGWHHHMTMVSAAYVYANVGAERLPECARCS
jgi:hypothetical protein